MEKSEENIHFSIVVLCYGGGRSIIPLVEKLHGMLSSLNRSWEIILVGNYLDGKIEETPQIVRELAEKLSNTRFVTLSKKGMAGWDVKSGLDIAQGKYIGFIDGDGQMPLESILDCLSKIESEQLDLVKTYRISRGDGFYRRFISIVYNWFCRLLFGMKVRDVNSNPKILLHSKYLLMKLQSDDWFIDPEMMLRAKELGLKIGEVPMNFLALEDRVSFVNIGTIFEFLLNMFRYRLARKPFHYLSSTRELIENDHRL